MNRNVIFAAVALLACAHAPAFATPSYPADGFIGVYGDPAGTNCCLTIPPTGATTLHVIATSGGASSGGFTGAEFRIEVSPPAPAAFFVWQPNPAANIALGNPIDNSSTAGDNTGVNIAFASCQRTGAGAAGDHTSLGTITIFGLTGEHTFFLKKHNHPSNPNNAAPLLVLCDSPTFTAVPLSLKDGDPALFGQEAFLFRTPANSATCDGSCGFVAVTNQSWTTMKGLYR